MGKIVERKKKKKGRPSLLDLQKRNLREQQQHQIPHQTKRITNSVPHSHHNYKNAPASSTPNSVRRSTRRNPNPDPESPDAEEEDEDDDEDDEEEEELTGKRREKKLKLVLKLPSNQKSSLNSASQNSYASDSNAEEDNAGSVGNKKRKINAIGDGSGLSDSKKGIKSISGTKPSNTVQEVIGYGVFAGTKLDLGPSTPLPDKKLLLFILERLQKKDTYGVYSEPADPEELPDYHEVIEHPMDFGTVKKKLTGGAYTYLEEFEKDIYLICTNAMQYNAPDTVYFRQARSIHELAKKNFENLRQDSDDNNEPVVPKVVRRGRPPTKNLKKQGSEYTSDGTLATTAGGENATLSNHEMRKGPHLQDKSGLADISGRVHGSRNNDVYSSFLADKLEKNDEFTGSAMRGNFKNGKKHFVLDDNRRNTYLQPHPSAGGREPSVLTTFDGEKKQLMPVGLLVEHGYARSLARFAANLGPVAWKIASKKIEMTLPAGAKFGPGWVVEDDILPQRSLLLPGQPSVSQPSIVVANSSSAATSCTLDSNVNRLSEKPEGDNLSERQMPSTTTSTSDSHPSKSLPVSAATSSASIFARSHEPVTAKAETAEGLKPNVGFNTQNNSIGGIRPRPPFPIHQGPTIHPGMNGYNGFNLAAQMGKLMGPHSGPPGFNIQSSQMIDTSSRNTNKANPATGSSLTTEETNKLSENRTTINSSNPLPNPGSEATTPSMSGFHPRPSWQGFSPQLRPDSGLSTQQKSDSVPPDLNVRFQSPGSPSSSRVDSTQPDLALQL
ncbi:hypothetical protein G4B88_004196 [Cannabis sativa]|uniref:Bromo domain-containing protein n=1 Tax=Cannabis sativa TaxID=3483 RepID=A0A7J6EZW1_CANSA|nr:hypothetical protein G4B88_004196 [Cannabis sativa]